ncbi:phytanoyl-CoA dioxygenase family protein [Actinocatenispora rupis]|uniref:Phytanoyl-CoA dioxygenase n=1 Tax=Actinocatenispora rupis TaxID=519421 RepID=A0A8J3J5X2_9ACTN|nr:phytanoyl-CoA dioxygenase family protein [Actinocatenispora rupis]GID10752.1 phytanoyl-CoA dioxygenase [Actinocatenispora rupis]
MLTSNGYVLSAAPDRLGELAPVPDRERHDRDALWARLRAEGHLYLPGALDADDVRAFRRWYFDALAGTGLVVPGSDGTAADGPVDAAALRHRLFRYVVPSLAYQRFCTQPAVRDWYAWFLGGETFLHRRKILRHTRPGERGVGTTTQAHYDLVYLREGTDRVLSSWIPLGDCPVSLGGLVYLERSHLRVLAEEAAGTLSAPFTLRRGGRRPAAGITADLPALADEYRGRWLVADYAAGDMVVHSAHVIHASLDNVDTAGRMRLSTDIRYQRADEPIDWRWQRHWHDGDGL